MVRGAIQKSQMISKLIQPKYDGWLVLAPFNRRPGQNTWTSISDISDDITKYFIFIQIFLLSSTCFRNRRVLFTGMVFALNRRVLFLCFIFLLTYFQQCILGHSLLCKIMSSVVIILLWLTFLFLLLLLNRHFGLWLPSGQEVFSTVDSLKDQCWILNAAIRIRK